MQAKLIVTFDRLSNSDFLANSGSIVNAMTNNSHYQNLRATGYDLRTYIQGYHDAATTGEAIKAEV